jgi:anti-sigma factor RsiW
MCNQEHLIGYLYGELPAADRALFEAHLAECAECRDEVQGLRQTRHHLTTWAPPEPEFNFSVVRNPPPTQRRPWSFVPQWALAAAAAFLVVAGAASVANLDVQYGTDGLRVRTGWTRSPEAPQSQTAVASADSPAARPAVAPASASDQWKADVDRLTRRLEELERAQATQISQAVASAPAGISAAELRKILAAVESRQRQETALLIKHLWNDVNAVRANDFLRVQQTIAPELQRQRLSIDSQQRSIDYMFRNAAQQK